MSVIVPLYQKGIIGRRNKMTDYYKMISNSTSFIRKRVKIKPAFGIVLGSGLGGLVREIKEKVRIPYDEIPHFPVSTVEGLHAGNLIVGKISGRKVVAMEGRVHYYEGYSMKEVTFPIRVMKALGSKSLIITSAVGAMNPMFETGDIVAITDHVNLMGDNPLIGPNDDRLGPRFPDMSEPYHRRYIKKLGNICMELGIPLRRGVMIAVPGPNLETAAEYRFLRRIGADVVGMSMVPETIAAVHGGMKVLGITVVTDKALPDCLQPVDIAEIVSVAKKGERKLCNMVREFLKRK
jgi:purine-nucleoside phosphorylase